MLHIIISSLIALVMAVSPWALMAQEVDMKRADVLIKKYTTSYERPKSCPLESKKFSDLIAKTEAIKSVLKSNCMDKNEKMTEVLDSIQDIQDDLKDKNIINNNTSNVTNVTNLLGQITSGTSSTTTASTANSTTNTNAINGLKYSALFSNISTMFKKNKCNMEDGRVLEMTADLIYDSTQLGVLAGNELGLVVAGGGLLISSTLRLIDLIFKQRFDFDKTADRQSFIKLNCSFYEIRRELDLNGVFDSETNLSREDYRDVKAINESITKEIKRLEEEKTNLTKTHDEMDKNAFKENVGNLEEFKKTLVRVKAYLLPGITANEIPSETQKLLMISKLAQDYDALVTQVQFYKSLSISSIPMLDSLFINELKIFDSINEVEFIKTLSLSSNDFNNTVRAKILFHLIRISDDISSKEVKLAEKNQTAKKELTESLDKKKTTLSAKLVELQKVENRLGNLVSPKEYSGLDDGSENLVAIIENHKKISSQIYGEWGEKFLKYTTIRSNEEASEFNDKAIRFKQKYSEIINKSTTKNDKGSASLLCQDAQRLRLVYKNADSLVQEGFDFIVTNKDIIHTDGKSSYNRELNESTNNTGQLSSVEKIQRHYKSAVFALRKIKGEEVSREDEEQYLSRSYFSKQYIGRSMLDVTEAKKEAKNIQDIYERLACQKALTDELH
jgi:cell fate (sporulation/competence/biofilm development) regulator YmcA (YheA/YmcA/DUF963 family)